MNQTLDQLTTDCTAFSNWEALEASMKSGYVPTLNTDKGRSKAQKEYNQKIESLVGRIQFRGYPVRHNGMQG